MSPGPGGRRLFAVPLADRFFLLFERPPATCMWSLLVEGERVDPERFRAAGAEVLRRHPKAAARVVREGGALSRRLFWEVRDDAAELACLLHGEAPEEDLPARLAGLMNGPLDPADGPMARFHWLPTGGDRGVFALRFHHALGDRGASLVLLRDFLAAYAGEPLPPPPLVEPPRPLVPGPAGRGALLRRLVWLHTRRSARHGFAWPDKLFPKTARPTGEMDSCERVIPPAKLAGYLAAARAHGRGLTGLLVAAVAQGVESWKGDEGHGCGMLRILVNQDLRSRQDGDAIENRSSAFPVWIGRSDRRAADVVERVQRQIRECWRGRAAQATALLSGVMALPLPLARTLLGPAATSARLADSLVVSYLGTLPPAPPDGWLGFGRGRVLGVRPWIRPPDGGGAILVAEVWQGRLALSLCFLRGLLDAPGAARLLERMESALDRLSAAP